MRVFGDRGYRAGTVQLIAKEAGLSQAGLIHHFPTKEAILMAVLAFRDLDDRDVFQPAVDEGATVVEVFRRILGKNAEHSEKMRFFAVVSTEALSADHPAHDYFQRRYHSTLAATTEIVCRNQSDGKIRDDLSAVAVAELVIATAHGFRYTVLVGDDLGHQMRMLDSLALMLRPVPGDADVRSASHLRRSSTP